MYRKSLAILLLLTSMGLFPFLNIVRAEDPNEILQTTVVEESKSSSSRPAATGEALARLKELRASADSKLTAAQRQAKLDAMKKETFAKRCAAVRTNIDARLDFYTENHGKYVQRFEQLATNVEKAINRLVELGADTTEVTANLEQLNTYIEQLNTALDKLVVDLTAAQAITCDEAKQTTFKTNITAVEADLKQIRELNTTILNFVKDELKPSFEAIKATLKPASRSATSSKSRSAGSL